MNAFYKEQKKLMERALETLVRMDALEIAADEVYSSGGYSKEAVEEVKDKRVSALQTDYALTVTTLMQNFCAAIGFTLSKKPRYLNSIES